MADDSEEKVMAAEPEWTREQLDAELKVALETWPLYRTLQYKGAQDASSLPENLHLYCRKCKHVERWNRPILNPTRTVGASRTAIRHRGGFGLVKYSCCNCPSNPSNVNYYFYWFQSGDNGEFFKAGQYPALDESVPAALELHLDKDDLGLYKTAIRLRNYNLGIGAVAYLRRVVENRINDMLDVLAEAAREHSFAAGELGKIQAIKTSHRFDEKIDYAAALLPIHLRPEGKPNPIDKLHELTSEGLHSKSEEDCIDVFDRVRTVFEYVFGNLRVHVEEARAFVKSLGDLQGTGNKKAPPAKMPPKPEDLVIPDGN